MQYNRSDDKLKYLCIILILIIPVTCFAVTETTFTIGSGKDYASLSAWVTAQIDTNLIALDEKWIVECYATMETNDSVIIYKNVGYGGLVTDANHNLTI